MDNFFTFRTGNKIIIKVKDPEVDMSIIRRLGKPKFWVSNNDFNATMEKIYKSASQNAKKKYESEISEKAI